MKQRTLHSMAAFAATALLAAALGCLDAGLSETPGNDAAVSVDVVYLPPAGKTAAVDSIRVALFDVTADPWTDEPESFPLAAENVAPSPVSDGTGSHYLAMLRVELNDVRTYRVRAFLSDTDEGDFTGERTIELRPRDEKSVAMVLTVPGIPDSGTYDLAVVKSIAPPGSRGHAIPIVLRNAAPIGGIQFQLHFSRDIIEGVSGVDVDPSSRLYFESDGSPAFIQSEWSATDSTAHVVTVDVRVEGDSLAAPLHAIPAGNDLVCFLLVDIRDDVAGLPLTTDLTLESVFFSTPAGSTSIAVPDPTDGTLVIAE